MFAYGVIEIEILEYVQGVKKNVLNMNTTIPLHYGMYLHFKWEKIAVT